MIERWRGWPSYARRVSVRLACLPLILFVLFSGVFVLLEVPETEEQYTGTSGQNTSAQIEELRENRGLDHPVMRRYGDFLWHTATFDYGADPISHAPTRALIRATIRPSAELLALSMTFGAVLAVGPALALRRTRRRWPSFAASVAVAGIAAIPVFVVFDELIILPRDWWGYAPPTYQRLLAHPWNNVRTLVPPALVIAVPGAAWAFPIVRGFLRSSCEGGGRPGSALIAQSVALSMFEMLPLSLSGMVIGELLLNIHGLGNLLFNAAAFQSAPIAEAILALILGVTALMWAFAPSLEPVTADVRAANRPMNLRNLFIAAGLVLVCLYVMLGIAGPWIAPHDTQRLSAADQYFGASWGHPFGTDEFGRDVLSAAIVSFRGSLAFSSFVVGVGFVPGAIAALALRRIAPARAVVVGELVSIGRALPFLPLMLVFVLSYGVGFGPTVAAMAVAALFIGFVATASLGEGASRSSVVTAMVVAMASVGALAIFADTTSSYFGLKGSIGDANWGATLREGAGVSDGYRVQWLGTAAVVWLATVGFLLVRAALDDEVPPQPYER